MFNFEELSWSDVRDIFRKFRENNERKSDEVVQLWEAILEDKITKVGAEKFPIYEQVAIAALDVGNVPMAEKCIEKLTKEFPGSKRVKLLKSMRLEALEMYDDALELLDWIIENDVTNAGPRKRKIAIHTARGNRTKAIQELTEYLKVYMSDEEAWHMLCSLYLAEGEYAKAAFCMEEILLHNPHSHLIHQRIAEIRYTMGGLDNMEIAKTYYSQAVKLNSKSLRGLYGLYLTCNNLANSKLAANKKKEAQKTAQWALKEATEVTKQHSKIPDNDKFVTSLENAFGNLDLSKSSN